MDKDKDGAGDYMDRGPAVGLGAVLIGLLVIAGSLNLALGLTGEARVCGYVMVVLGLLIAVMYGSAEHAAAWRARAIRNLTDQVTEAQEEGQTYLSEWNLERAAWDGERATAKGTIQAAESRADAHRMERDAARRQRDEIAAERDRLRIERDRADALVVRLSDGMRLVNAACLKAQQEAADVATFASVIRRRPEEEVKLRELLDFGWAVIANVGGGEWATETAEWRESADLFQARYFKLVGEAPGEGPAEAAEPDDDGPPTVESLAARMDTIEEDVYGPATHPGEGGIAGRQGDLIRRVAELEATAAGLEKFRPEGIERIVQAFIEIQEGFKNVCAAARDTDRNIGKAETYLRGQLARVSGEVAKLAAEVEYLANLQTIDTARMGPATWAAPDGADDTIQAHLAELGAKPVDPTTLGAAPRNWPPAECGACPCPPACCVKGEVAGP